MHQATIGPSGKGGQVLNAQSYSKEMSTLKTIFWQISPDRTQSSTFLVDRLYPELGKISKRLEMATNLKVRQCVFCTIILQKIQVLLQVQNLAAENFQVGLYGAGGLYLPHIVRCKFPTLNSIYNKIFSKFKFTGLFL